MTLQTCLAPALIIALATSVTAQNPQRFPVPTAAALLETRKLVADVYRTEYEAAKTPLQKQSLAKKLLVEARKTQDDPTARFMLLDVARKTAAGIGDASLALEIVHEFNSSFATEGFDWLEETLATAANQAKTADDHYLMARFIGREWKAPWNADNYEVAQALVELALSEAKKAKDGDLVKQWSRKKETIEAHADAWHAVQPAIKTLNASPADASANAAVGKYRCLIKEEWQRGLPMLALSTETELQKLAERELRGTSTTAEQLALADGWYEAGTKAKEMERVALWRRAKGYYQKVLPSLSVIARRRIEQRAAEITAGISSLPKNEWIEILDMADLSRHVLNGTWSRQGLTLTLEGDGKGHIKLPVIVDGSYELRARCGRLSGAEFVRFGLGKSGAQSMMGLNIWGGTVSGVWFIDGKHAREPGHGVPPLPIVDGRPYNIAMQLDRKDDDVLISVLVDSKRYYRWQGTIDRLSSEDVWKVDPQVIGGWDTKVFFQSVQIKVKSGTAWVID